MEADQFKNYQENKLKGLFLDVFDQTIFTFHIPSHTLFYLKCNSIQILEANVRNCLTSLTQTRYLD